MDVREMVQAHQQIFEAYHRLLSRIHKHSNATQEDPALSKQLFIIDRIQEEIINYRLQKILNQEHPYLPQIHPGKLEREWEHQRSPLSQIVQHFIKLRQQFLNTLNALPSDQWRRSGVHETEGHVTFKELVRRMIDKDRQVLKQLDQLTAHQKLYR